MQSTAGPKLPSARAGDPPGGRRSKRKYISRGPLPGADTKRRATLTQGMLDLSSLNKAPARCVLVMCDRGKETAAAREVVDALEQVLLAARDPEEDTEARRGASSSGSSISAQIQSEIESLKSADGAFLPVRVHVPCIVLLKLASSVALDPRTLVSGLLDQASQAGGTGIRLRACSRVVPLQTTCYADAPSIVRAARPVLEEAFGPDVAPGSFAVHVARRYNDSVSRMDVITPLAELVHELNAKHTVDLEHPLRVIVVEVVGAVAGIAVLERFNELSKYNVRVLQTRAATSALDKDD